MKKSKKLSLQSLALVLMSFILVAGVAFGMTGAWFYDSEDAVSDTVTFADGVYINIAATEAQGYFVVKNAKQEVRADKTQIFPGDNVTFSATVTNEKEAAKLRVVVEVDAEFEVPESVKDLNEIYDIAADGATKVISYSIPLTGADYTNENAKGKSLTISVKVYAVQAENYAEGLWKEIWSADFQA